jgi:hypothetical protein
LFNFQDASTDDISATPERLRGRRSGRLEEEPGQEVRRGRGVLHLLLHLARLQPSAAKVGLPHLQEEVSLGLPLQVVFHQQQLYLPSLQKSVLKIIGFKFQPPIRVATVKNYVFECFVMSNCFSKNVFLKFFFVFRFPLNNVVYHSNCEMLHLKIVSCHDRSKFLKLKLFQQCSILFTTWAVNMFLD